METPQYSDEKSGLGEGNEPVVGEEEDVEGVEGVEGVESYQINATLINHKLFVCLLSSRPHRQFFVHLGTLQ